MTHLHGAKIVNKIFETKYICSQGVKTSHQKHGSVEKTKERIEHYGVITI